MKKILIIFLALCLLCSCALADTIISETQTAETLVSYTIEACKEYTVEIPPTITIGEDQTTTLTISLDARKYELNPGADALDIFVVLERAANGFHRDENTNVETLLLQHTNGTDTIEYIILNENNEQLGYFSKVLDGLCDKEDMPLDTIKYATITLKATPTGKEQPGDYTDTLTFLVVAKETGETL